MVSKKLHRSLGSLVVDSAIELSFGSVPAEGIIALAVHTVKNHGKIYLADASERSFISVAERYVSSHIDQGYRLSLFLHF